MISRIDQNIDLDIKLTKEELVEKAKKDLLDSFDILKHDIEQDDFFNVMATLEEMLYHATAADTVIRVLKE